MASVGGIQCPALSSYRQSLAYCLPLLHKLQKQQTRCWPHAADRACITYLESWGYSACQLLWGGNDYLVLTLKCSMMIQQCSAASVLVSSAGQHQLLAFVITHALVLCTTWAFGTCGPEFACLQGSSAEWLCCAVRRHYLLAYVYCMFTTLCQRTRWSGGKLRSGTACMLCFQELSISGR
jgi:hypothetical protein